MEARLRFVLWAAVIVILVSAFIHHFLKVEEAADHAVFTLATKNMLDRANRIKQIWILRQQPSTLKIDKEIIELSKDGWVYPKKGSNADCERVLSTVFPKRKILNIEPNVESVSSSDGYNCIYHYTSLYEVKVILSGKRFLVLFDSTQ
ncbi:hypothetical protein [Vibrio nitrifigilis]|uniref:MSHA biogenesis protein MshF n=1 Tax=Vibrio nitrifigilis TaxID=2789781 RepID=A0ABS0GG19_9VIBR|nr:hypothetical protein [Vibrio nitrifigilis]MBF9001354.1 hypothetical protein [Vibrio nitrifigilis]